MANLPLPIHAADLEQAEGKIVVVRHDEEGKGSLVGEVSSGGANPCTLLAAGTRLLMRIGNYSSATFTIITEPPQLQVSQSSTLKFKGTPEQGAPGGVAPPSGLPAPHPRKAAHPRSRDAIGVWVPSGVVAYMPEEDRGTLWYSLTNEVTAHRLPPAPEERTLLASVHTLRTAAPPEAWPHRLAAEILIAASPAPYLYVSNRDDSSPEGDTIAISSLADPAKHELVNEFGEEDARWLIAGGVLGGGVKVLERVDGGKDLKQVASLELEAPTGFLWLCQDRRALDSSQLRYEHCAKLVRAKRDKNLVVLTAEPNGYTVDTPLATSFLF
ncbi:predicted protein [Postia placenta Mad-698-R]|nr:predicted protein [Postia placenta Mad-698-R]